MPHDVIAFPRRQGVFLAAVLGEESRSGRSALLSVEAEDGKRFGFPVDGIIARVSRDDGPQPDEKPREWLRRLRSGLTPFSGWAALHGRLEDGALLDVALLTEAAELSSPDGLLEVALGTGDAAPWFRREPGGWRVVPIQDALKALLQHNQARWVAAGEEAVLTWWRAGGAMPPEWEAGPVSTAAMRLEQASWISEPDYEPDVPTAAAFALSTVVDAALRGQGADYPIGADLPRRMGLADDFDRLFEALVERGALAADADPARHRADLHLRLGWDDVALPEIEALAATPVDSAGREDLTGLFTVAVDDDDTREVDDAVSLRRNGDAIELFVHIADVASAVPKDSALDLSVRARAASLYLPGDSELMFPAPLVVDRLSLTEGAGRAALTAVFRIGADGMLDLVRFVRSLVSLDRRVDYPGTRDVAALAASAADGQVLVDVARALLERRLAAGARVLRVPGFKVTATPDGPQLGTRLQDTPGDLVVSETMVLTNTAAAERMAAAGAPALYRAQGSGIPGGRALPAEDDPLYALLVRRTFAPTEVRTEPRPHAGIGAEAYAQCTSPMRRYADLVNQRQLLAVVDGTTPPHDGEELTALGPALLERERRVRRASDGRTQRIVAGVFQERVGQTLRGILSRMPKRGLGSVWVPELCRELPLRAQKGWRGPPVGTETDWRISAVAPLRGRVELAPA